MAKILIATGPKSGVRMRQILEPHHTLTLAKTIDEAFEHAQACDLLVCGLEFDESRMFDFLRQLNEDTKLRVKPVVCIRFLATKTPDHVIDGLEVAAKAVGASSLVDVPAVNSRIILPVFSRIILQSLANYLAISLVQASSFATTHSGISSPEF